MTDQREPDHPDQPTDIHDQIDDLLPVPDDDDASAQPETVDSPLDEVIPAPTSREEAPDDSSTREELEVDTSADGLDDIIVVNPAEQDNSESETFQPIVSGSDRSIEPDAESHAETEIGDGDKDTDPIETGQDISTCAVCGHSLAQERFCPNCGTEQAATSAWVARLNPFFAWSRPLAVRVTLTVAAMLALIALLSDSGTAALVISASVVPVVLLISLAIRIEGWAHVSRVQSAMMLLVGLAAGTPIAWIATRIVKRSWIDGGVLQFGATSFGGVAAGISGAAPFLVWLVVGLLLPLILLLVIGGVPAGLRMALSMNPRESAGMMLSAGVAAGYLIGSAAVFYQPLGSEIPPIMSTSQWTLTIVGIAVFRPLIWVASGAMLGAVVWRYLATASLPGVAVPGAIAAGIPLLYTLFSLASAPAGLWTATLLSVVFAVASMFMLGRFIETARKNDLKANNNPPTID